MRRVLHNEKAITWADIPGYKEILKALFEEMKTRYISQYPDALVEAVTSFLSNAKVLNSVIRISFSKTWLYDTAAVRKSMQMTAKWFLKLNKKLTMVPGDFDWTFFMKGIDMLITLDHSTSTAYVIWLLYQIIHTLPKKEKDRLLRQILEPATFYNLFFHWSWNVRRSFYYFYYF